MHAQPKRLSIFLKSLKFIDAYMEHCCLFQANITRTNHVMWTMGTDFKYQYAHTWFRQMDKFIHYVNQVSSCLYFVIIVHHLFFNSLVYSFFHAWLVKFEVDLQINVLKCISLKNWPQIITTRLWHWVLSPNIHNNKSSTHLWKRIFITEDLIVKCCWLNTLCSVIIYLIGLP